MGQSPICSPAGHIDCTSTHFSHYTVLPAETLVFATSNKWLSISLYGVPDSNDTQMIHVPWKLFTFFLPMREGNAGLTLQNTYLECTLDTLNNWFYNNSCFPSKIVQVQWFCKISTFCYWLLVFLSTYSKCSLRQPNPDRDLRLWPGLVYILIGLYLSVKNSGYRPAEQEWLLIFPEGKNCVLKRKRFLIRDLSPVCSTLSAFGRGFFSHMFF